MDYRSLAKKIIANIGGDKNVSNVYHCATRLRFTLKDNSIANKEAVEKLDGVITVVESGGMFQVVIGNSVNEVYAALGEFMATDSQGSIKDDTKKDNLFNSFINMIAGVFAPTLGVLSGTGLIKGFLALLTTLDIISVESGTYLVLNAAADSFFYFLPIFLAYTAAKKFKTDSFTAMAIAGALVYPTVIQAFTDGMTVNFMGIPLILARYTSTVIPIIIAVWVLSYVEKFFKKILHESIKNLLTPFFCILILVPLTLIVVGPISDYASQMIANGYTAVYSLSPLISGAVIGGLWQVLVMFGLHWGMVPIMTNNLAYYGRDTVGPACFMAVAAQAGAVLGVLLKTKNVKMKSLSLSAFISALFGITEPAVYGITLKYKRPFIIACSVGGVFGAIVGAVGAGAIAIGPRSVLTFPIYIGKGFPILVASYFLAIVVSCGLTYMFGYKDEEEKETISQNRLSLTKPVNGQIIDLNSVKDEIFSSGALGNGFAVIPSEGVVTSPIKGKITTVFPTKHALGILSDEGAEVLIHIGIDTVNLNGKYFETLVQVGDQVDIGEDLVRFNNDNMKKEGYDTTVIIVVTNSAQFKDISLPAM